MRERHTVFLVIGVFISMLILAQFLLPEMSDPGSGSRMNILRRQIGEAGQDILLRPEISDNGISGPKSRHGQGQEGDQDVHRWHDKEVLWQKIAADRERDRQKLQQELKNVQLEVVHLRKSIEEDKARILTQNLQAGKKDKLTFGKQVSGHGGKEKKTASKMTSEEIRGGEPSDLVTKKRRDTVRKMMQHAWKGYTEYAWGHNEVRPVSKQAHTSSVFGTHPLGASIVDGADTLFIMGLDKEFTDAKNWIINDLNFDVPATVSVFEFNIRFLAGLLSLYTFTENVEFLDKARLLADKLLPAFKTPYGLPHALINLRSKFSHNYNWASGGCSILSEFGTLHMEFAYLSELTGDSTYYDKVATIRKILVGADKPGGLYFNYMNPKTLAWGQRHASMAGLGDSFYEYLLKEALRSGGADSEARRMYDQALDAVERNMLSKSDTGLEYLSDIVYTKREHKMDHLACFAGGMFALGANTSSSRSYHSKWMKHARGITETCHESYIRTATHLGPESFTFESGTEAVGISPRDTTYILRPETVESYFYLWRMTGEPKYREWAWDVVQALEKYCKSEAGYSGIQDITNFSPRKDDVQQSFFLAETLKYLYLIFSENSLLPLDRWVFNTEAHPFPIRGVVSLTSQLEKAKQSHVQTG